VWVRVWVRAHVYMYEVFLCTAAMPTAELNAKSACTHDAHSSCTYKCKNTSCTCKCTHIVHMQMHTHRAHANAHKRCAHTNANSHCAHIMQIHIMHIQMQIHIMHIQMQIHIMHTQMHTHTHTHPVHTFTHANSKIYCAHHAHTSCTHLPMPKPMPAVGAGGALLPPACGVCVTHLRVPLVHIRTTQIKAGRATN